MRGTMNRYAQAMYLSVGFSDFGKCNKDIKDQEVLKMEYRAVEFSGAFKHHRQIDRSAFTQILIRRHDH